MTLPSSGNSISLNQVQTEFGGSNPIGINEYYSAATGLPSSGQISLSNFYGLTKPTSLTSGINVNEILASSYISDGGTLTIPSDVWVWSDDTGQPALKIDVNNATIINYGKIIGKGGAGGRYGLSGAAGGPAITVTGTGNLIKNMSGAYIAGGGGGGAGGYEGSGYGGGGGGGAGGGAGGAGRDGGDGVLSGGAGGSIGNSGSNGASGGWNTVGYGGSGGGAGAGYSASGSGLDDTSAGGGGGRVLPSTTTTGSTGSGSNSLNGKGGDGGGPQQAGGAPSHGQCGAGGGGWGAAGGASSGRSGGAAGAAISGSAGYTNAGAIYGSNAATLNYVYSSGTAYVTNGSSTGNLNSNFGSYTLHNTVWDYQQSGNILTFTAGTNALGSLRFRATADPDPAPRSNSGNDRQLILYKNGTSVYTVGAAASSNAVMDTTQSVSGGDVFVLYMNNSMDWRDLGGFERIVNIHIDGA